MTTKTTAPSNYGKSNNHYIMNQISKEQAEYGKAAHSLLALLIRKMNREYEDNEELFKEEYFKIAPRLRQREITIVEEAREMIIDLLKDYSTRSEILELYSEYAINVQPILDLNTGNADVVIVTDDIIHIIDLKTGKIHEEEDSYQLRIYGLGASMELATDNTRFIKLSVIQDGKIRTKTFEYVELVKPLIEEGKQALLSTPNVGLGKDLKLFTFGMVERLIYGHESIITDEVIHNAKSLERLTKLVETKGEHRAKRGFDFDDFGITEGRRSRTVTNMVGAINWLSMRGFNDNEINDTRLRIGALENLMSEQQFEEFSSRFVETVQAKDSFKRKRKSK